MSFLKPLIFLLLLLPSNLFPQDSQFIEVDRTTLHFRIFGIGDPLVIINGGPGMSSEGFIPLAKELAGTNQVIIYDQRGTGYSKIPKIDASSMTLDLLVEDLESLRKYLQHEDWIILGHSFGGMLAYAYAAKYPGRVKAMIQSSSGGMDLSLLSSLDITTALTASERDSLQFYREKIARGDTSQHTHLKRAKFLAPAYVYNRAHIPVVAKRLTQGNREINSLIWNNMRQQNFDKKSQLKYFEKPVLILHGENDVVHPDLARNANLLLPQSQLVILPNTRHYGWLDAPEFYFNAISNFLNGL